MATLQQGLHYHDRTRALTVPGGGATNGTAGTPVTINLAPTGGTAPYQYTVNCTLPPGLTFSNGVISGTPTTPGTYTCRIVISDSTGHPSPRTSRSR